MIAFSAEINAKLSEIQAIATSLPQGGDVVKLRAELWKLANTVNGALLSLGRLENQDCDCKKTAGYAY